MSRARISRTLVAFTCLVSGMSAAEAAAPSAVVQAKLAASTFEVVAAKPEADPLTYEKPLPLDLLPFKERNDKFQSIGTAFLIAPNQFVTAAHVLGAAAGSQYGQLSLRDASGKTYAIAEVLKYSNSKDLVVFSVQHAPEVAPLEIRGRPPLNTPVFAVGNAFGEGIVIRDGLYTSDSPEELEGRWNWLRFSAAASPGNSGGPLVDQLGRVIGVVLRKSPSENLNFAIAMDQVTGASTSQATFELRNAYHPSVAKASDTVRLSETLPLPQRLDAFYAAVLATMRRSARQWRADYLAAHAATMFPRGAASEELLHSIYVATQPRLILEDESGHWIATEPKYERQNFDANGFILVGQANGIALARLRVPDDMPLVQMLTDSKAFMDLLLKVMPIQRTIGPDKVRVTSAGAAAYEEWFADRYGRRWLRRAWKFPFSDSIIEIDALPTPDGAILELLSGPTGVMELARDEGDLAKDHVYLAYTGSLKRWQEFLAHRDWQPATFATDAIQIDLARGVAVKTDRFKVAIPSALQGMKEDGRLTLKYTFLRAGDTATWALAGVFLSDADDEKHYIDVLRREKPPENLPTSFQHYWQSLVTKEPPYGAVPFVKDGARIIKSVTFPDGARGASPSVAYVITARAPEAESDRHLRNELSTILQGLSILAP